MKKFIIFLQLILFNSGIFTQIPVDSLIGYWPFNGNANDVSDNQNNGQVIGAVLASDRFGVAYSAYYFDGINNKITCSSNNFGVTLKVSISAWIKTDSGDLPALIVKYDPNEDKGYVLRLRDIGNASIEGRDGNGIFISTTSSSSLYDGKWHHLVGIIDSNIWSIWVDGNLDNQYDSYNYFVDLQTTTASLIFGALSIPAFGNYRYFNGSIDDIRIYNRALTPDEINELYNEVTNNISDLNYMRTIDVFPNPSNAIFYINFKNFSIGNKYRIKVIDLMRQEIYSAEVDDHEYCLDLRSIRVNGMFFLFIIDSKNEIADVEKLILR